MNYKVAKQLKDAGFPQEKWIVKGKGGFRIRKDETTYIPILEELIDECGDKFERLEKIRRYWTASGKISANERIRTYLHKTKKEAVAKLWLKLNK